MWLERMSVAIGKRRCHRMGMCVGRSRGAWEMVSEYLNPVALELLERCLWDVSWGCSYLTCGAQREMAARYLKLEIFCREDRAFRKCHWTQDWSILLIFQQKEGWTQIFIQ